MVMGSGQAVNGRAPSDVTGTPLRRMLDLPTTLHVGSRWSKQDVGGQGRRDACASSESRHGNKHATAKSVEGHGGWNVLSIMAESMGIAGCKIRKRMPLTESESRRRFGDPVTSHELASRAL